MHSDPSAKPLRFLRLWLFLGWCLVGAVIVLSLVPTPPESLVFEAQDKLMHVFAYGVLMLWFGAIYPTGRTRLRVGVLLALLGVALEGAQGLTSYRSFQGIDMAANGLGVAVGWLCARTRLSRFFHAIESHL